MAAICPIPNGAVYSASKIAGDFIGWGLTEELKKYKTDVCMWRAAGVSTKIINSPGTNCCVASPEQYVAAAFSKCTSGVHSAFCTHEIMHLFISNIKDIFGVGPPMWFFSKLFGHAADDINGGEKKKAKNSVEPQPVEDNALLNTNTRSDQVIN